MSTSATTTAPLFVHPGVIWKQNNQQIWTTNLTTAQLVWEMLQSLGFVRMMGCELAPGLYKFEIEDRNGLEAGADVNQRTQLSLFLTLESGCLGWETIFRLHINQPWRVFRNSPDYPAWFATNHEAANNIHDVRKFEPDAFIAIRPALVPFNQPGFEHPDFGFNKHHL